MKKLLTLLLLCLIVSCHEHEPIIPLPPTYSSIDGKWSMSSTSMYGEFEIKDLKVKNCIYTLDSVLTFRIKGGNEALIGNQIHFIDADIQLVLNDLTIDSTFVAMKAKSFTSYLTIPAVTTIGIFRIEDVTIKRK